MLYAPPPLFLTGEGDEVTRVYMSNDTYEKLLLL